MGIRSKRISTTIGPTIGLYLDDMLDTGFYGLTRSEVMRRLIFRQIEISLSNGIIQRRKPMKKLRAALRSKECK